MERGIRVIHISALASVLWLGANIAGHAQTPNDPSKVDILGFHLGMLPGEMKQVAQKNIDDATFTTQQRTLSMGQYSSDPLVFGVQVTSGPAREEPEPDKDSLYFSFDLRAPYKTINIFRKHIFSKENAPTVRNLVNSLIEKYGQPTPIKINGANPDNMVWTYGVSAHLPLLTAFSLPSRRAVDMTTAATIQASGDRTPRPRRPVA